MLRLQHIHSRLYFSPFGRVTVTRQVGKSWLSLSLGMPVRILKFLFFINNLVSSPNINLSFRILSRGTRYCFIVEFIRKSVIFSAVWPSIPSFSPSSYSSSSSCLAVKSVIDLVLLITSLRFLARFRFVALLRSLRLLIFLTTEDMKTIHLNWSEPISNFIQFGRGYSNIWQNLSGDRCSFIMFIYLGNFVNIP